MQLVNHHHQHNALILMHNQTLYAYAESGQYTGAS